EQVDGGQIRDATPHLVVQLNCAGTEDDDQGYRSTGSGSAYGIDELGGLGGAPIVKADERDVNAAGIPGEQPAGVQQFLKDLVVGGEGEFGGESEFPHPEGQTGLDGFGGKRGADRDVQILLY